MAQVVLLVYRQDHWWQSSSLMSLLSYSSTMNVSGA
jgi:hypothetical protein